METMPVARTVTPGTYRIPDESTFAARAIHDMNDVTGKEAYAR
jgi:hypothetical protein